MSFFIFYFVFSVFLLVIGSMFLVFTIAVRKSLDGCGLFSSKKWVLKFPVLLFLIQGIVWPFFFYDLTGLTVVHRESGHEIRIAGLVTGWERDRMGREEFLVLDEGQTRVWYKPEITLATTNGMVDLIFSLKFDGDWEGFVENARTLAPCVPRGESDLRPTLGRALEDLQVEHGDRFLGVVLSPGFKLHGYIIQNVTARATKGTKRKEVVGVVGEAGEENIIDQHDE